MHSVHVEFNQLINADDCVESTELKRSMGTIGQCVPILVRPVHNEGTSGEESYKIIDGLRRTAAAKSLEWSGIWAVIDYDANDAIKTLAGNIIRKRNIGAEIKAITQAGQDLSNKEIAAKTSLPLKEVNQLVKLRDGLDEKGIERLQDGTITLSAAKQLLRLDKVKQRAFLEENADTKKITITAVKVRLDHERKHQLEMMAAIPVAHTKNEILAAQLSHVADMHEGENKKLLHAAIKILQGKAA